MNKFGHLGIVSLLFTNIWDHMHCIGKKKTKIKHRIGNCLPGNKMYTMISIIGAPYVTLICFEPVGLYIGGRTKCRKWMSPETLCTTL